MGEERKIDPDAVMIFFRDGGFYQVLGVAGIPLRQQAREHATINPGTIRVEDAEGEVLWPMQ